MTSGDEGKLFAGLPEQPAPERTYQDKPRLRMAERRQIELRAICLDDLVPTDHRVRMVWTFVEGLDVSALVAAVKAVEGRPGHPPADPRILLALWLYATACWRCGCMPRPAGAVAVCHGLLALAAPASWRGC